jgi:hypothetical protein
MKSNKPLPRDSMVAEALPVGGQKEAVSFPSATPGRHGNLVEPKNQAFPLCPSILTG